MQLLAGKLLLAASDLIDQLECAHLTRLNLEAARGERTIEDSPTDAAQLIQRKGEEHELEHLAALKAAGKGVVEIKDSGDSDRWQKGIGQTLEAMHAGADVIHQAVLFDGERWRGYADFLERVPEPSKLGDWSYEVGDAKLARRVKPYYLLQLCLYSDLLAGTQGLVPRSIHVVLGSKERHSFRLAEFAAYYRRVKRRFEEQLAAGLGDTYPDRIPHCAYCRWAEHCDAQRETDDHLCLVAHMQRSQILRLNENGIATVAELGQAGPDDRPAGIGTAPFERLRVQARLQTDQRRTGKVSYELLEPEENQGLARLPEPSEGDLFFDMEGDPFFDQGLEYLFGVITIDEGEPHFHAFWATDRGQEKQAFEAFMDFAIERLERFPNAQIYHYAPYEPNALKRLMGMHATRENEVDHLLRQEKLVDLYKVVRQGLRISQPSYSIKKLEPFYMPDRTPGALTDGEESIVEFERYLDSGDKAILESIERYNDDDCRSTLLLRNWLLERREEAIERFGVEIPFKPPAEAREPDAEDAAELGDLRDRLLAEMPDDIGEASEEERSRWLLAQVLDYHRREAKPAWWAYFDRLDSDQETLTEQDSEALGSLTDAGIEPDPLPPPKTSLAYTLRFPPQDHKIGPGKVVDWQNAKQVTVDAIDDGAGQVRIARGRQSADQPLPPALIPGGPYNTDAQRAALRRFATDVAERGLEAEGGYVALRDILRRDPPRTNARSAGEPLQGGPFDLDEAKAITAGLEDSYLFIQGPPGSGKTYTGAHLILDLLARGKRVGVASGSHKAINNLLGEVERFAVDAGVTFRGLKKTSGEGSGFESQLDIPLIDNSKENADFTDPANDLIAGTAWLFAREELAGSLDYLFIDEAGQISLADALAMGTVARNLILLGDPLQLAQVSQAAHPPGGSASVLEHLLGDQTTIPPDRGLFIDKTRRMHPDVCEFISETVYEGRLESYEDCARQRIDAPGDLTGTGVRWIPVEHSGNTRQSPEEADAIAARLGELLRGSYTDANGEVRDLREDDVMVVTPYNAQVRSLRERLPDGVRVGTVDKFQGQEAAIVFFSMATSSGTEIPRNLEFLFSRNRLNVAISRARCLAVLVCSPELLHTRCRSAEQMRLVNALCRLAEVASHGEKWVRGPG